MFQAPGDAEGRRDWKLVAAVAAPIAASVRRVWHVGSSPLGAHSVAWIAASWLGGGVVYLTALFALQGETLLNDLRASAPWLRRHDAKRNRPPAGGR